LSYDIKDYAKLGLLHKLLHVENPAKPSAHEVLAVKNELIAAIADARSKPVDLSNRRESAEAFKTRKASILVRAKLEEQWRET
jgi:hypothetical protein